MNLFKKDERKLYIRVVDSIRGLGIETFCDDKALLNMNAVYKSQTISALQTALEMLIGQQVVIQVVGDMYDGQKEDSRSREAPEPVEKNIQHPLQEMQTQSVQVSNGLERSRNRNSKR